MADHRTPTIAAGTEPDTPPDTAPPPRCGSADHAASAGRLPHNRPRNRKPVLLRSVWGLPLLSMGSTLGGAAVVVILILLSGAPTRFGPPLWTLVAILTGYLVIAMIAGITGITVLRRRSLAWLDYGETPTPEQALHTLALPKQTTLLVGALWSAGIAIMSTSAFALLPASDAAASTVLVTLGGLATMGYNFLFVDRALRPIMAQVLAADGTLGASHTSVMSRMVLTWALSTAGPLVAAVVLLNYPGAASSDRIRAAISLAVVGLLAGILAETILARSVAQPLRHLRTELERIALGDNTIELPVDDSSEIGVLQSTVNDMVAGFAERDRMRELFGRHVGKEVAARALAGGADPTGEIRDVTAVFIDVRDSTALAYRISPHEFVDKLNRLLADVISATDKHGGLVNKFEGDAALCIFGAPVALDDDATAALQAAREIRDRTLERGELETGIGLAKGPVFAGNLGTDQRLEYTVIGDAVNQAARLTDLAKSVPGKLLASDAVLAAATDTERSVWHPHTEITLRGRGTGTKTWTNEPSTSGTRSGTD